MSRNAGSPICLFNVDVFQKNSRDRKRFGCRDMIVTKVSKRLFYFYILLAKLGIKQVINVFHSDNLSEIHLVKNLIFH